MKSKTLTAIFPGTFDPITNGHIDLITRASQLFPRLIIAVAQNPSKKTLFALDERVNLASSAIEHLLNVEVIGFDNLMADFAQKHNATVVVRGVRTTHDFEYERQLAEMNRALKPDLDTIFLMPSIAMGFISSTIVKDVAFHGGDISNLVPLHVKTELLKRLT
ncbi:pantetheine-phosphate adenylyltransferase [Gilliamella sp. wkB292]|uniref:pantetheine-phosphate adenylyltransferase n=1 Tax=unclassified Gilliamella TaxID=2685620 RepID=UPI00080DC7B9|nr:pantetheine-phosphate adenylyltransferase [Gilliamella apicola]OCG11405.1 pantetheine-phosphate adenylyltransferase [Gilliamella apicola]OCL19688.1 pantetheine-phosphate adenylyltransferase [Gilliamella apicola]